MKWMPERTWNTIQSDSKRWTQRACTSCRRYGLESEGRLYTHQTVGCGIPISLLALRFDLHGLRSKFSWIRLMFFSDTRGRPELLPLLRQPICSNWWFQRQMLFLVGGWMLKRRRNALHSSRRPNFNELTNAKNLMLHSIYFALNWRCCTTVRSAKTLPIQFENIASLLSNLM